MNLPTNIAEACEPLFTALPLNKAMSTLTGSHPECTDVLQQVIKHPVVANRPLLISALWLYCSDLDKSHTISQGIEGVSGAYWHGIMHRREGDFSNGHYWMRMAARHPLKKSSESIDADIFIDEVASARGKNLPELVEKQRQEWANLFEYCAVSETE